MHESQKFEERGFLRKAAREINEIKRILRMQRICESPGVKPRETGIGTMLDIESSKQVSKLEIKQYRVKSVQGDYLTCRTWDSAVEGSTDVLIAKPFRLRRTPFDGLTKQIIITWPTPAVTVNAAYLYHTNTDRKVTISAVIEEQTIIPRYSLNDIIYAAKVADEIGLQAPHDDIDILDINADGRAWAQVA